jgi:hypothetical protein
VNASAFTPPLPWECLCQGRRLHQILQRLSGFISLLSIRYPSVKRGIPQGKQVRPVLIIPGEQERGDHIRPCFPYVSGRPHPVFFPGGTTDPMQEVGGLFPGCFSRCPELFHGTATGIPRSAVYRAFFTSITTRALHRGHWIFTGFPENLRLASRIPMYVHA